MFVISALLKAYGSRLATRLWVTPPIRGVAHLVYICRMSARFACQNFSLSANSSHPEHSPHLPFEQAPSHSSQLQFSICCSVETRGSTNRATGFPVLATSAASSSEVQTIVWVSPGPQVTAQENPPKRLGNRVVVVILNLPFVCGFDGLLSRSHQWGWFLSFPRPQESVCCT